MSAPAWTVQVDAGAPAAIRAAAVAFLIGTLEAELSALPAQSRDQLAAICRDFAELLGRARP